MSFLNPVNEPVLRFSSTDAGAPQINYNARVAGDVKAVLKACLVSGYGSKAGAGWSASNETTSVAEFVSPSLTMSAYRLCLDDNSTTNTTWYYQYQNSRVNPKSQTSSKSLNYIDKTSSKNGWVMLVTSRGFIFVENFLISSITPNPIYSRITFFSQLKSGLLESEPSKNIGFWRAGFQTDAHPATFFSRWDLYATNEIGTHSSIYAECASVAAMADVAASAEITAIDLQSSIYLRSDKTIVGKVPGILVSAANKTSDLESAFEVQVNQRPCLSVVAGYAHPTASTAASFSGRVLIYLDSWDY